jgi:NADH dehydrogenase (ubiquinone) 1 alpha subcomplex subunit 5
MKTCYHIMEQLSIGFPETCIYRIYNEERTKYLMKIVDETPDIEQLEDYLCVETIEIFIDNLVGQLEVINIMRHSKIWERENTSEEELFEMEGITPPAEEKNPAYKKPVRPKASFLDL